MRITQGTMMRQYNRRLNQVMRDMNLANQKVITGRRFMSASENPAAYSRLSNLNKNFERNNQYIENVRDIQGLFDVIESAMISVWEEVGIEAYADKIERALNGTMSVDERKIFATDLRVMQETLILNSNAVYNGEFIYGGSNKRTEPPFELKDGKVYYRGVDVDGGNRAVLNELADEKIYIDFGFGLTVQRQNPQTGKYNEVVDNSAFNIAVPGITFLGYGKDENGDSNNIIVTLGKIADALEEEPFIIEKVDHLWTMLNKQRTNLLTNVTGLGAKATFLESTLSRLETNQFNMEKRIQDTAFEEPAQLILDFSMRQYVYNTALKMGNSILSPSFIDFMR